MILYTLFINADKRSKVKKSLIVYKKKYDIVAKTNDATLIYLSCWYHYGG